MNFVQRIPDWIWFVFVSLVGMAVIGIFLLVLSWSVLALGIIFLGFDLRTVNQISLLLSIIVTAAITTNYAKQHKDHVMEDLLNPSIQLPTEK